MTTNLSAKFPELSKLDTLLMSICTGFIVANIYYCQPLIILFSKEFQISETTAGKITFITQAGYAVGLFILVPLGDMFERKRQILIITCVAIASLIGAAIAPSFLILAVASFLIGASSIVPQLILPLAANLSSDENRGKNIGIIMSGLLVGILGSRVVSGTIGDLFGWRSVFLMAAIICFLLLLFMAKRFPVSLPTFTGNYLALYRSMLGYFRTQPVLREASIINFFAFAVIMSFWTTMVLYLANAPFHFSAHQIGLFGIAGAAGALAAPIVGRLSGKKDPKKNVLIGCLLELVSIVIFYFTGAHIVLFIAGIILIDIGQQAIHVTNQTRIYALVPEARNRLNTVFMTISFIGASLGSAMGLLLWEIGEWKAYCLGSASIIVINMLIYLYYRRR